MGGLLPFGSIASMKQVLATTRLERGKGAMLAVVGATKMWGEE